MGLSTEIWMASLLERKMVFLMGYLLVELSVQVTAREMVEVTWLDAVTEKLSVPELEERSVHR